MRIHVSYACQGLVPMRGAVDRGEGIRTPLGAELWRINVSYWSKCVESSIKELTITSTVMIATGDVDVGETIRAMREKRPKMST